MTKSIVLIEFVYSDIKTDNLTSCNIISVVLWRDGNNLNQINAEDEDDFLDRLATEAKTQISLNAAVTFESIHVRSLLIYEYFMAAITS